MNKMIFLAPILIGASAFSADGKLTDGKTAIKKLESYISVMQHSGRTPEGTECEVWATFSDATMPAGYKQPGDSDKQNPWTNIIVTINPGEQETHATFVLASSNSAVMSADKNQISLSLAYTEHGEDAGHREQAKLSYGLTIDRDSRTVSVRQGRAKPLVCVVDDLKKSTDPNAEK